MLTSRLGSRIYGQFASTIPVIWSIGYMVIPDAWSILAGPEADLVSGTHCINVSVLNSLDRGFADHCHLSSLTMLKSCSDGDF